MGIWEERTESIVVSRVTFAGLAVHHVTNGAADVLGLALECIVTLLAAGESTTLLLELFHGHGWKRSRLVVGGSVVVYLVNGNCRVSHVGLNGLLVDNGLDGLVDVLSRLLVTDGSVHRETLNLRGGHARRRWLVQQSGSWSFLQPRAHP